jgi:hypothetical protein
MKLIILIALCFLAWFATQGKFFNVSLPAFERASGLSLFGYALRSDNGQQTSSALDRLFPSLKDIDLPAIRSSFEKFANGYSGELSDGMSAEQKRQLEEMGLGESSETNGEGPRSSEVFMPLTAPGNKFDKIQNILRKTLGYVAAVKAFFIDNEQNVFTGCVFSAVSAAVLLLILFAARFWRLVRLLTGILFTVSGLLLIIASVISPLIFYGFGANPWQYASGALFWLPAALLIIGAVSYRFLERNFPVWKKLYSSFSYPVFSGAAIFLKHFLPF